MSKVLHFEIPADNPDRAIAFYTKVFGWKFEKWDGPMEYWMVDTGPKEEPGIGGGLLRRPHPGSVTCNTVGVASADQAVASIEKAGGSVVQPKMAIPGIGWLAYCSDTEGNVFSVMQADANAK